MIPSLLLVALPSTSAMFSFMFWVAIAAVVVWAIISLIKWSGIVIPPPVRIIFVALVSILLIGFLARLFGVAF